MIPISESEQSEENFIEVEDKRLYSVFQPIYSFSNQACIGAEALVRGKNQHGFAIPVADCLKKPESMTKADYARMLNRMHLNNWQSIKPEDNWIFLNLDFRNLSSLKDFCLNELLDEMKVDGNQIVIEVVESEIADEGLFEELILQFRKMGCLIALDDFGAGHSNIDRIWKAQPDIVKLDRQVLLEASKSVRSQSVLRNLSQLIKQAGSISLLEGIETEDQALLAMDVGVDLVQGFYFARPDVSLENLVNGKKQLQHIVDLYPKYSNEKEFIRQIQRKGYETLFESLDECHEVAMLEGKMQEISSLSFVKRFFVLDESGYQISEENSKPSENHLAMLKKGKGLCWKNRRYFFKAMDRPGTIYVSGPYRSLIDMQLCLTVSKQVTLTSGQRVVACFDVFYHDKAAEMVQISV
ncbi:EAL domain-containing protein [Thiomicrorhabdus sp. zzn3]|uniref:EAL domain-containing protein n=1 Tax=Thiomicrorhabdus sp. zzn3 TaxID=3039775 RepID=UPI0024365A5F|nr:EAL domain-containing protein [Thiomicrorhabdus sp. zzn3]MDG6778369.1 EAL domain-containing protein [Thiomicrorhabdus sp. zzn3]